MIWIIGNRGMLGQEVCLLLQQKGIPFVGSDQEVSVLDPLQLEAFAKETGDRKGAGRIDWIVNCAAYTAVDRAEDEPEPCFKLNAEGPRNIARIARSIGASFVHISTDYVFDGEGIRDGSGALRPYLEEDPVNPRSVNGQSKLAGEEAVRETLGQHIILRTAWLYGKYGNNFVYTMLRLMKERDSLGVVADQRGTPTWAFDLSGAILTILQAPYLKYGTYHYTNEGETSWYEFAREIHRLGRSQGLLTRDCEIRPLTTEEYPTKAHRPGYSVLSKEKIKREYHLSIPPWQESLKRFMDQICSSNDLSHPNR